SLADYQEARTIAEAAGDKTLLAKILNSLANHTYWQGKVEEARGYYRRALDLHRELGDRRLEGIIYGSPAGIEQEQGQPSPAWGHLGGAPRRPRQARGPGGRGRGPCHFGGLP